MTDSAELDPEAVRIGATIRALREALGWKRGPLAEVVGKSYAYLCNIEAGRKRCTPQLARQIADALGVPVGAIVSPAYDTEALMEEARSA
ncbi:helix-turn-helix transcriptional regulator [Nonomuraea sp. NPDC050404]|uniref:helix-turn-helix domain-containing protein n=1 Tax=Nonomuraea sp. NPDC050404 TaxID=3155783 RepID=UPI0033C85076